MNGWKTFVIGYFFGQLLFMIWSVGKPRDTITPARAVFGALEFVGIAAMIAFLV